MAETHPLLLPLRVLHERAAFAVERGGAVLRQAARPRFGRRERDDHRRGSSRPGCRRAVEGHRHLADGDPGGCPGVMTNTEQTTKHRMKGAPS